MNNRQLILQVLDFIEAELHSPLSVNVLSKTTGYSLYHFIRLFQAITGITPGDYIARRKITEAALDIVRMPDRSFQEISLDYHFNDYETFTRSFKRLLHTTPTNIRRKHTLGMIPLLHRLEERDLLHLPLVSGTAPAVVELEEIILQGPIVKVATDHLTISETWNQLFSQLSDIKDRKLPESYYQVGYWPEDFEDNGVSFLCACQIRQQPDLLSQISLPRVNQEFNLVYEENSQILTSFPIKVLPPAKYLKFLHIGLSKDVSYTYKYIYESWLPKSDYRLSIPFEFEYYGDHYLGPNNKNSVSEIYIPLEFL